MPDPTSAKPAAGTRPDIVLENARLRLVIGGDGCAKSLVVKATGEEMLDVTEGIPAFSGELFSYEGFTTEPPYRFTGVRRGRRASTSRTPSTGSGSSSTRSRSSWRARPSRTSAGIS